MRATFTTDGIGRVTLSYDQAGWADDEERITREFSCPVNGGYVIEFKKNGDTKQVCDRLGSMGSTLMASSRATLIDVIRREYKAMRAAERRDADRY